MKGNTYKTRKGNNMENKNINIRFPGFSTFLGIAFIVLKLCKVINWAWIWVLAPIWISWALTAIILIITLIVYWIATKITKN